ncbi:uncharacterized protein LOC117646042 [Thrips palmi]|uniref:Uncharacterized protein LOC117646042 n=1 Tax=Thrips palmi TaxID=161013 RepID=A0A6P8ZNL8_THRPL|nr:uncharacterized protein LOC117646042 [Thrips palmi]
MQAVAILFSALLLAAACASTEQRAQKALEGERTQGKFPIICGNTENCNIICQSFGFGPNHGSCYNMQCTCSPCTFDGHCIGYCWAQGYHGRGKCDWRSRSCICQ